MTLREARHAITADQAERERQACYREISRSHLNYTYQHGAFLTVVWHHKEDDLISVAGRTGQSVARSIRRYKHRGITHIFITIPSKANTQ